MKYKNSNTKKGKLSNKCRDKDKDKDRSKKKVKKKEKGKDKDQGRGREIILTFPQYALSRASIELIITSQLTAMEIQKTSKDN